ncbi:MAG: hypothetical protein ACLT8E_08015 [Akkermansia sp.]
MNESDDFVLKRSAARILGEIGSETSLSALKAFTHDADNELRLCAELSVNLIEKRLGIDSSAKNPSRDGIRFRKRAGGFYARSDWDVAPLFFS